MYKKFLFYLPAVILSRLSSFVVIFFGSHFLPKDELGYLSLIVLISEFLDSIFVNWIRIAISRFISNEKGEINRKLIFELGKVNLICTLLVLALIFPITKFMAPEKFILLSGAIVLYLIGSGLFRFSVTLHQASHRYKAASFYECTRGLLIILFPILAMVFTHNFIVVSVISSFISILIGVIAFREIKKNFASQIEGNKIFANLSTKYILRFSFPIIIISALSQLITSLDKFLIKFQFDVTNLAIYYVSFTCARSAFDIIGNSFNTGGYVKLSSLMNEKKESEISSVISKQLMSISSIFAALIPFLLISKSLIAKSFFPAIYAEAFGNSFTIIMIGSVLLNIKNFVFDNIFHMKQKNLLQIPSLIFGAVASILASSVLLFKLNPYDYAASIFLVGAMASLMSSIFISSKLIKLCVSLKKLIFFGLTSLILFWVLLNVTKFGISLILPTTLLLFVNLIITLVAVYLNFIFHKKIKD